MMDLHHRRLRGIGSLTGPKGIHRYLVTGTDLHLMVFHHLVYRHLNAVERRGNTVLYTCFEADRAFALEAAKTAGVSVQEWAAELHEWEIIAGSGPGWSDTDGSTQT
jgi:hypothetical protein